MKRWLAMALVVFALFGTARASAALSGDVETLSRESLGSLYMSRLRSGAGEVMILIEDEAGEPLYWCTEVPAEPPEASEGDAAEAARRAIPDALILQIETEGDVKLVRLAAPKLFGTLWVVDGRVIRRDLKGGAFVEDGRLTLDGALHAAQLVRPEAVFTAVEYDAEDGAYEGDARLDGASYDFEIDAQTGQLLE